MHLRKASGLKATWKVACPGVGRSNTEMRVITIAPIREHVKTLIVAMTPFFIGIFYVII